MQQEKNRIEIGIHSILPEFRIQFFLVIGSRYLPLLVD